MDCAKRWHMIQAAATRLNVERAGTEGVYTVRRGQIVGFGPCPRAHVFLAATYGPCGRPEPYREAGLADIDVDTVLMAVIHRAALTWCPCHAGITVDELIAYQFEAGEV